MAHAEAEEAINIRKPAAATMASGTDGFRRVSLSQAENSDGIARAH